MEKPSTFFSRLFFVLTTSALTQPAPTAGRLNRRTPCVSGKLAQPALNIRPAASTPLATLFSPSLHLSISPSLILSFPHSPLNPVELIHLLYGTAQQADALADVVFVDGFDDLVDVAQRYRDGTRYGAVLAIAL